MDPHLAWRGAVLACIVDDCAHPVLWNKTTSGLKAVQNSSVLSVLPEPALVCTQSSQLSVGEYEKTDALPPVSSIIRSPLQHVKVVLLSSGYLEVTVSRARPFRRHHVDPLGQA